MLFRFKTAALLGLLILPVVLRAEPVPAQFRGCDSAGWCRFWVEPRRVQPGEALEDPIHRVRPLGIPEMRGHDAVSIAVRDRLNALMSSFVHQHKRVMLYDLRELADGTFSANITVNESDLASDPMLQELLARRGETSR